MTVVIYAPDLTSGIAGASDDFAIRVPLPVACSGIHPLTWLALLSVSGGMWAGLIALVRLVL